MGHLSLLVAPLLTAFFVVAIRLDSHKHRWSWRSGRVLAIAIVLTLQAKGMGNHASIARHAPALAALQSRWDAEMVPAEKAERVASTLSRLGRPSHDPPLVGLLAAAYTGGMVPGSHSPSTKDKQSQQPNLRQVVRDSGVALLGGLDPWPEPLTRAVLLEPAQTDQAKRLLCGHRWLGQWGALWWPGRNQETACAEDRDIDVVIREAGSTMRLTVVFAADALSPGWLTLTSLRDRPDGWLLMARSASWREAMALRVAIKHHRANAMLSKRPSAGAVAKTNEAQSAR